MMRKIGLGLLGVITLPVVMLALMSLFSRRPANLGVVDGRLAPCPDSPNCVSSQTTNARHRVEPWPYQGTAEEAMARLASLVRSLPEARIVTARENYLHAEFTSRLFRFVDDVEWLIDPDRRVIHVRSASRAGRSDFGVNRRRVESLRRRFAAEQSSQP